MKRESHKSTEKINYTSETTRGFRIIRIIEDHFEYLRILFHFRSIEKKSYCLPKLPIRPQNTFVGCRIDFLIIHEVSSCCLSDIRLLKNTVVKDEKHRNSYSIPLMIFIECRNYSLAGTSITRGLSMMRAVRLPFSTIPMIHA